MRRSRGRIIDVDTVADFDHRLAVGACDLSGWRVHGLDLTGRIHALASSCRLSGSTFLGCTFGPGEEVQLAAAGALVLPAIGSAPVDVYRRRLYTADELYDDSSYARSLDGRAYSWSQDRPRPGGLAGDRAARPLHRRGARAVDEHPSPGRHDGRRTRPSAARTAYAGAAATLGRLLGAEHMVATGGGPGSMEAANLGASLSAAPLDGLDEALAKNRRGAVVPAVGR